MSKIPPFVQGNVPPAPGTVAQLFTRHDWGALPPRKSAPPLATPVVRVVTTWANVKPCTTVEECKERVRQVQRYHMETKKLIDIEHNFLVGGDGNIYEGRGWFNVGPEYPSSLAYANDLNGKSVEIAFLDKEAKKPNEVLVKAASDCVAYGLIAKFLQEKVQFYWRTPDEIRYVSSYQTNAPGTTRPGFGFSDNPDPEPPRQTYGVAEGIQPPESV